MSGGHFNYKQHHLLDMADDIGSQILTNDSTEKNEWGSDIGKSRKDNMKDDDENLFAYGWLDTTIAIILALCTLAALCFALGYLL